jgi:hypothetical protein
MRGTGDFDFLTGSWDGAQRRLLKPLAGCTEWDEFSSVTTCWSLFGGAANVDEVQVPDRGWSGVSLRLLDVATRQWSIYWANSKTGELLMPPVVGGFTDGVGRFYNDEEFEGKPITVRYLWTGITATTARWEQAFSPDGRRTWETNWTMDFTRRA